MQLILETREYLENFQKLNFLNIISWKPFQKCQKKKLMSGKKVSTISGG